eukprot:TRINITY_DN518_c0_g2_i3.p1 TRINITY_DN518_c0_g2~~TRINITY_DN518_c0_g2_i3.p1  ORF type:complete len:165 (+),score=23.45 TRINITY_DN518_c0_g2_i3:53-547(+)
MTNKDSQVLVLAVLNGSRKGNLIPVLSSKVVIGRSEVVENGPVDVCIQDDSISQIHAVLKWVVKTKQWGVKDKKSSNGTSRNNEIVKSTKFTYINSGDVITFGDVSLLVQILPDCGPNTTVGEFYDLLKDSMQEYLKTAYESQKLLLRAELQELIEKAQQESSA